MQLQSRGEGEDGKQYAEDHTCVHVCVCLCVSRIEKPEERKFGMKETGKERREKRSLCGFESRV